MPDIQSAMRQALTKTLQQWDDDDEGTSVPVQPVSISFPAISEQKPAMTKQLFPIKNNITRVTFNYVRDNPGSTRKEIITALDHQGFRQGSTSSLLSQLGKNQLIHSTNGLFYADVNEYTPLKPKKAPKQVEAPVVKRKYERKATAGIGALLQAKLENAPMPSQDALDAAARAMEPAHVNKRFTSLVRTKTPHDILQDMTVYQAHELYVHLKQMFGG